MNIEVKMTNKNVHLDTVPTNRLKSENRTKKLVIELRNDLYFKMRDKKIIYIHFLFLFSRSQ